MVVIGGTIRFPAENEKQIRELLAPYILATRSEPGNLHYAVSFDLMQPGLLNVFEAYVDEAAFDAHRNSEHMATWRAGTTPLGLGGRELIAYTVSAHRKL